MVSELGFSSNTPQWMYWNLRSIWAFDGENVAEDCGQWEQLFCNYMIAGELTKKTKATRVAILLHCAGPRHLTFTGHSNERRKHKDDVDTVLKKFQSTVSLVRTSYMSDTSSGKEVRRKVRTLGLARPVGHRPSQKAASCGFGDPAVAETMIKDKIVFGVLDRRVNERLLWDRDLALHKMLDVCCAAESNKRQMEAMTVANASEATAINTIKNSVSITRRTYLKVSKSRTVHTVAKHTHQWHVRPLARMLQQWCH